MLALAVLWNLLPRGLPLNLTPEPSLVDSALNCSCSPLLQVDLLLVQWLRDVGLPFELNLASSCYEQDYRLSLRA